jgi:D-3-phosphoglycerate dehydrogenase
VGRELLEALRPGAYVINTSRGEVMDQPALLAAIESRGLRAGLDVFASEPAAAEAPFTDAIGAHPSVYGTHHIGASTEQASEAVGDEVVRIIETFVVSGRVPNVVNLASRSPATHLLIVRHADRVGVLAHVLGHLRQAGSNVQEMENIIFQGAEAACARIQITGAPTPEQLGALASSADIYAVSLVPLEPR